MSLPSTTGEHISLDMLGPGRTILYIHPLADRPDTALPEGWDAIPGARGCTSEACDFRDHHANLCAAGAAQVLGVSSQTSDYQQEMVDRRRLPFVLLSDAALSLATVLGLPTFATNGLTLYNRLTLVIRNSAIEHTFYPIFRPNEHATQVLACLHAHPVSTAG